MKLIIAGSRTLNVSHAFIHGVMQNLQMPAVTEVVDGGARGIDTSGRTWATLHDVRVRQFPADWNRHGPGAGHIRNREMAEYADALLLIWDGESRGSTNMLATMRELGKPVYEVVLRRAVA